MRLLQCISETRENICRDSKSIRQALFPQQRYKGGWGFMRRRIWGRVWFVISCVRSPKLKIPDTIQQIRMSRGVLLHDVFDVVRLLGFPKLFACHEILQLLFWVLFFFYFDRWWYPVIVFIIVRLGFHLEGIGKGVIDEARRLFRTFSFRFWGRLWVVPIIEGMHF